MIILVVCFCKWYLKSYFCICSCLLWHKSTAPPPHPNINVSHSLSSPSFLILFELFFLFLKGATEMNVLSSTRSICHFLLTSHFVFASLIFAHSCPPFCLFPFFLRKAVISNTSVCPRTTEETVFNLIDSLIIRYPHFSVYFHSPHTHTLSCTRLDLSKEPTCAFKREPACPHSPFPSALQSSLAAWP